MILAPISFVCRNEKAERCGGLSGQTDEDQKVQEPESFITCVWKCHKHKGLCKRHHRRAYKLVLGFGSNSNQAQGFRAEILLSLVCSDTDGCGDALRSGNRRTSLASGGYSGVSAR